MDASSPARVGHLERLLRALHSAASTIQRAAPRSEEAVFDAVETALRQLDVHGGIMLLDETGQNLVLRRVILEPAMLVAVKQLLGLDPVGLKFPWAPIDAYRQVLEEGCPVLCPYTAELAALMLPPALARLAEPVVKLTGYRESLIAPLVVEGRRVGLLAIAAKALTPLDIPAFSAFADQVSAALESACLYQRVLRRETEAAAANAILQKLNACRQVDEVFEALAQDLRTLVHFDRASVALVGPDGKSFVLHALVDQPDTAFQQGVTFPLEASAAAPDILAGRPHLTADLNTESNYAAERLLLQGGVRSRLNVPLRAGAKILGALNLASKELAAYTIEHARLLEPLAGAIAVAIDNAFLYQQLESSEARFRHLVENVHDLIYEVGADGTISYCSPSVKFLAGYTAEELVGTGFAALVHPDDLPAVLQHMQRQFAAGGEPIEFRLRHADGRYLWARCVSRPVMQDGKAVRLTGIATDITVRKEAELALQRREAILSAISFAATHLLQAGETLVGIQSALGSLAAATGVDCISVFKNEMTADGSLACRLLCSWTDPDTASFFDAACQSFEYASSGRFRWAEKLGSNEVIHGHSRDFPSEEREFLEQHGIQTVFLVPIFVAGSWWGFVGLADRSEERVWSPAEIEALRTAADLIGAAWQREQTAAELRRHSERLEALLRNARDISSSLELDEVLQHIVDTAVAAIPAAEKGSLHLYDAQQAKLVMRASVGYSKETAAAATFPPGEGYAGWVFAHRTPLVLGNVHSDPRTRPLGLPEFAAEKSALCVPLLVRDQAIGTLSLDNTTQYNAFSTHDRDVLLVLASQAAVAIENARLFAETRQRAQRLATISEVVAAATSSVQLDEILGRTVEALQRVLRPDRLDVLLADPHSGELTRRASIGPEGKFVLAREAISPDATTLVRWVAESREPVLEPNFLPHGRLLPLSTDARSVLCVPLCVRSRTIGVLNLESGRQDAFGKEDLELVTSLAGHLATLIDNARLVESLRESETRYRALFEQASDAVFLETIDGQILDVNEQACTLLGYTREELLARTVADLVPPEVRASLPKLIEHEKLAGGFRIEAENLHKDGTRIPVEVSTSLLRLNGTELLLALVRDMRERKQLEEQLRQAQKMQAVGTLAGGIAHDFNNLLAGILGYASLLERDVPPDSPLRPAVSTILAAARRGADLTAQLLAFARRGSLQVRPVNVNEVVADVVNLLSHTVDKSIAIQTSLAADLAPVAGDPGQLHQVVLNLCLNACDAMPAGGELSIETANLVLHLEHAERYGLEPGQYVRLAVRDTGCGMDHETQQRIFEPFFSTKRDRSDTPHSGLGLAMVWGIVQQHGGAIRVKSAVGQGSTFEILLPTSAQPDTQLAPVHVVTTRGSETLLVVDDEEFVRRLLVQVLQEAGYTVLQAADGLHALELYRQYGATIALVILDMGMPRLSGRETFRRLRELNPDVAVLISSGYAEDSHAEEMLQAGARGFLAKPYDIATLLRKVREVLDAPPPEQPFGAA